MRKVIAIPIVAGLLAFAGLAAPLGGPGKHRRHPSYFQSWRGITQHPGTVNRHHWRDRRRMNPRWSELGTVTVADETGNASGGWDATAVACDFTGENNDMVIPSSAVSTTRAPSRVTRRWAPSPRQARSTSARRQTRRRPRPSCRPRTRLATPLSAGTRRSPSRCPAADRWPTPTTERSPNPSPNPIACLHCPPGIARGRDPGADAFAHYSPFSTKCRVLLITIRITKITYCNRSNAAAAHGGGRKWVRRSSASAPPAWSGSASWPRPRCRSGRHPGHVRGRRRSAHHHRALGRR